jgi:photosystem II stability/assembly factor-like uncharacterized protein
MKKVLLSSSLFAVAFLLSGCGNTGSTSQTPAVSTTATSAASQMKNATVIKSVDSGLTWQPKVNIDGNKTITGINVLTMIESPADPNIIYLGTDSDGLFVTKDGGETWKVVAFAQKAYSVVIDPGNPDVMYGSGIFKKRAKIFKRLQEDQEWKEVYTEPSEGTIISSLVIDKSNPQILYAGTSAGVIVKSTDGGQTWVNLKKADGPIIAIGFDAADNSHVLFGVFQAGVLETKDSGKTIEDITKNIDTTSHVSSVYTIATDPYLAGVVYVGTGSGIFRSAADGTWSDLNIIESSKAFPIRSIAVNPTNSKEIIYSSAKAIYKSVDSGQTWATIQLDTSKEISSIIYDRSDPGKVYAGLRSF